MSTAPVDCKMAKILLKKFGYLEKRVTYLEGKARGQEKLLQKLKAKLKRLKITNRNQVGQSGQVDEEPVGESSQEFEDTTTVDVKPNLIEVTGSTQNAPLDILQNDEKLSQKLVVNLGVRCSEKIQEFMNSSSENSIERNQRSKISQKKSHQNLKNGRKSSKSKRPGKKSHICAFCSKLSRSFADLSKHMRVHTGERPFKCQICSKSFTQMGALKSHSYVHTGERPFKCKICSKSSTTIGNLKLHTRVHTGERPYKCQICSKSFNQMGHLKSHSYVHTGEEPLSCSICSQTFKQASGLYYHMSIHKGTFPCSICSKKLGSKPGLKIHKRTHTGERPYYTSAQIVRKNLTEKKV